ncbi:hypothetical protein FRC02_002767 [Tulasnella sp. 418]|nr:hypothetical protein FRC02_002767 [Tulasnella sp. 418]
MNIVTVFTNVATRLYWPLFRPSINDEDEDEDEDEDDADEEAVDCVSNELEDLRVLMDVGGTVVGY